MLCAAAALLSRSVLTPHCRPRLHRVAERLHGWVSASAFGVRSPWLTGLLSVAQCTGGLPGRVPSGRCEARARGGRDRRRVVAHVLLALPRVPGHGPREEGDAEAPLSMLLAVLSDTSHSVCAFTDSQLVLALCHQSTCLSCDAFGIVEIAQYVERSRSVNN